MFFYSNCSFTYGANRLGRKNMDFIINDSFFSVLFILIGVGLIFLEIFVPSGGIIGIIALAIMGLGIAGFFHRGATFLGIILGLGATFFVITMFFYMLRRITLQRVQDPENFTSVDRGIAGVEGKSGITKSVLRPAGVALIDGKRIDVVASGAFIEQDKPIKVVNTRGNRVVVKELPDGEN